jgi:hypothetical protein
LPPPGAPSGKLHTHPDIRADADFLGVVKNQLQLGVLLDDGDDEAPHLLGQHRHLDELGIFEAVADDGRVIFRQRDDREQLGLAPSFEAKSILSAEIEHFLDDLSLLVHLDGIHAAVPALVLVLRDCALKCGVDLPKAVLEDVGEPQQDRGAEAAKLQAIDESLEVDAARRLFRRVHLEVPLFVDREVTLAPPVDVVQLGRFGERPLGAH